MYRIEFSKTAKKQLLKLKNDVQKRVISTLERIKTRPYPHLKKLVGSPFFRLRIGEYRAILEIHEDDMSVVVIEVGHRKNIYQ